MSALMGWLTDYYSPHEDSGSGLNPERPRWWIMLRILVAAGIVTSAYVWAYPLALRLLDGEFLSLAGILIAYLGAALVIRPRVELQELNPFYIPEDGGSFVSFKGRLLILLFLLPGRIVGESVAEAFLLIRYAFSEGAWKSVG